MRRGGKLLCLALAMVLAALAAACHGGASLRSDLDALAEMDIENVLQQVLLGAEEDQTDALAAAWLDLGDAAASGAVVVGTSQVYTSEDGSVLTVEEDGTCTYETLVEIVLNGSELADTITLHGTVADGVFSFTKVTYFGLDITALAQQAGYGDMSQWEAAATALYGK